MKNIILAVFIISTFNLGYSSEIDCDSENNLSKLAKGFAYPNCNVPKNINELKVKNTSPLCNTCKKDFELIHGKKIVENKNHLQEEFFHSALHEYKKNVTNNLFNALKMKSIYGKDFRYNKSISACQMKEAKDFAKSCNSPAAKLLLSKTPFFDSLSKELSNDVAKFISTDPKYKPHSTLLKRNDQSCFIPESDILLFSTSAYEEAFSKEIIEYIQKVDPTKYADIDELFNSDDFIENFGDGSDLKVSLQNHPLISGHLKSLNSFIDFAKKIPKPSSKESLRSLLYSPSNAEKFDQTLAESCTKSFEVLQKAICSPEFEVGKIYNDPLNNFAKFKLAESIPTENELSSTEALVDTNIKLLELCESKKVNGQKILSDVNFNIGISLSEEQKSQSFEMFKESKYDNELGALTTSLCEMTDRTCVQGTLTCSIYQKYKAFNDPKNKTNKPINFANNEGDALLRAMLGDPSKIEPEAKQILVAHGILPREDGKFMEKPQMPESQQDFFAKMPSQRINPGPGAKASSAANSASTQAARTQPSTDNNYSNNSASNNTSSVPSGDLSDISDLVRGSTEDIKDIQDEIKRRLSDLPKNKPASNEDAKKIARDTFKNKGRKITPYQEQALADRMLQSEVPNSVSTPLPSTTNSDGPAVSDTETQAEKWRNGQKDAALMGMAGAQKVLANDASAGRAPASVEAKPKDLTKVALNIAEDPKVKLSDIFANKIDQNDPETQLLKVLLKNKNNFLLQVKGMNFKIIFDSKNNFNVLLESGDRAEAERMRPQLEIFLKRLKS